VTFITHERTPPGRNDKNSLGYNCLQQGFDNPPLNCKSIPDTPSVTLPCAPNPAP